MPKKQTLKSAIKSLDGLFWGMDVTLKKVVERVEQDEGVASIQQKIKKGYYHCDLRFELLNSLEALYTEKAAVYQRKPTHDNLMLAVAVLRKKMSELRTLKDYVPMEAMFFSSDSMPQAIRNEVRKQSLLHRQGTYLSDYEQVMAQCKMAEPVTLSRSSSLRFLDRVKPIKRTHSITHGAMHAHSVDCAAQHEKEAEKGVARTHSV